MQTGHPDTMRCPHGQLVDLKPGRKQGRFVARVPADVCPLCAAHDRRQRDDTRRRSVLSFTFRLPNSPLALRRQQMQALLASGRNPRAAVEATVREVTCRFPGAKVRVRGQCRVSMTIVGSGGDVQCASYLAFQAAAAGGKQRAWKPRIDSNRSYCIAFGALLRLFRPLDDHLCPSSAGCFAASAFVIDVNYCVSCLKKTDAVNTGKYPKPELCNR